MNTYFPFGRRCTVSNSIYKGALFMCIATSRFAPFLRARPHFMRWHSSPGLSSVLVIEIPILESSFHFWQNRFDCCSVHFQRRRDFTFKTKPDRMKQPLINDQKTIARDLRPWKILGALRSGMSRWASEDTCLLRKDVGTIERSSGNAWWGSESVLNFAAGSRVLGEDAGFAAHARARRVLPS